VRHFIESFDQLGTNMVSESPEPNVIAMRLEHHFPDSVVTRFASEVAIQPDRGGCYFSFFEVVPPVLTGTPEENKDRLRKMESIRAECVARVFVASYKLPEILALLQSVISLPAVQSSQETTGATESRGS